MIPQSNPDPCFQGQPQKMATASGQQKGLQAILEEHGFNVTHLKAKCAPVCPFESQNCCMARFLSQKEDFANQESMLETFIKGTGHECLFLPKFHCELNPIEMVSKKKWFINTLTKSSLSIRDGVNTVTRSTLKTILQRRRPMQRKSWMCA